MKRHLVLAIDFDGTITKVNSWPEMAPLADNAKEVINEFHDKYNIKIIIWTCRDNFYRNDLDKAIKFLNDNGIHYDAINENIREVTDYWQNNPRKIFADFYIDDKGFLFEKIDWLKIRDFIINFKNKYINHFI